MHGKWKQDGFDQFCDEQGFFFSLLSLSFHLLLFPRRRSLSRPTVLTPDTCVFVAVTPVWIDSRNHCRHTAPRNHDYTRRVVVIVICDLRLHDCTTATLMAGL